MQKDVMHTIAAFSLAPRHGYVLALRVAGGLLSIVERRTETTARILRTSSACVAFYMDSTTLKPLPWLAIALHLGCLNGAIATCDPIATTFQPRTAQLAIAGPYSWTA